MAIKLIIASRAIVSNDIGHTLHGLNFVNGLDEIDSSIID